MARERAPAHGSELGWKGGGNFKHFVEVDFINDLGRVSWQNVECFDDPNLAWQAWKSDFNVILDHHAPIRHMRVRQSSVPWLTFDIRK